MKSETPLLFVVGNPRSGTTMMGRILGNHPSIYTFNHEHHFFDKLWEPGDMNRKLTVSEAADLAARLMCFQYYGLAALRDHREFEADGRRFIESINTEVLNPTVVFEIFLRSTAAEKGKCIPCDQTPGYVYYLQEILNLFPEVKIINMVRDPRSVLHSQKNKWKRKFLGKKEWPVWFVFRTWMNYHPLSASKLWNAAVRHAYESKNDKRVYFTKFENVLEDPEKEVRKICDFIGVSYCDSMLEVPMIGSSLVPDKPDRTGIDKKRAYGWEGGGLNSAELFICQMITGNTMKRIGYKCIEVFPNPFRLIFYLLTFPVKLFLAILLQMKDIKDIRDAVKRRLLRSRIARVEP